MLAADGGLPPASGVIVPRLQRLWSAESVPGLVIEGLTFAHTDLRCPAKAITAGAPLSGLAGLWRHSRGPTAANAHWTCDDQYSMATPNVDGEGLLAADGGNTRAGELLYLWNCSGAVIRNVTASHAGGHALALDTCPEAVVDRSGVYDAGGYGIFVSTSSRARVSNSKVVGAVG